jgi:SAM-dependent methyltransferase
MRAGSSVLDVGCGCGTLPLALGDRLGPGGRYLGLDVDAAAIGWCERHLAGPPWSFAVHDYWNAYYNPGGRRFLPFAVEDASVDVVLMKSVLTHVLPEDLEFNLGEVARVLRPGGTALLTVFAYGEADAAVRELCPHDAGAYRYRRESAPEAAIAFPEPWLLERLGAAGLAAELRPGLWRGASASGPVYQDLLIARRA